MDRNLQELFEFVVARNAEAASTADDRFDQVAASAHRHLRDALERKRAVLSKVGEVSVAEQRGLEHALRRLASSYENHRDFHRAWATG